MEGVEENVKAVTDLEALKASARDIVEKANSQNGDSDHSEPENGNTLNGTVENGDVEMEDSGTNGEIKESKENEKEKVVEVEEDKNGVEKSDEEPSELHTEKQETHTVNGTSDSEVTEITDSLKENTSNDGDKNGETVTGTASSDTDNKDCETITPDNPSTDASKTADSPKEKMKTPKKKKKVDEVVALDDSPPLRRSSRKKTPTKYAELERDIEFVEEAEIEVEEIRDDDSDIQEVEPEDPLGGTTISITKSTKPITGKKPNVVTIDDLKTLQLLATSAKKSVDNQKKENLTIIDTQAILAGKMGSGVSITPAKPRPGLNITSGGLTLGSGVTIKPNTPKTMSSSVTITSSVSHTSNNISPAIAPIAPKAEESFDPNLTDDTFVVEAPSFIVPYVYEKPPKETIKDFVGSVEKIKKSNDEKERLENEKAAKQKEEETKKRREERQKKRDSGEDVEEDTDEESEDKKPEVKSETDVKQEGDGIKKEEGEKEAITVKDDSTVKEEKKPEPPKSARESYFESTLGKFFKELGMNLVQEFVQKDLLHQQKRRSVKDKSAAVMHAIMSLQKNLDDSKEQNEIFHHEIRKCKFCSFRTESRIVLQHHMETPHMKNFIYRCNFCEYETKIPQEVLFHMDSVHGVKGKLERAPYFHQCPQCPFEDNGKGKLTRHKLGCDKRFKAELNQIPERDWDPPAKIKPQPVRPGYSGYNYMQGRATGVNSIRPGQSLLNAGGAGRTYSQSPRMPMMNQINRGALAARGRPVGSYKGAADLRIPQPGVPQQNKMRAMSPQMLANQQMLAALNSQGLSVYGTGKNSPGSKSGSPSISITPLPGRNNPAGVGVAKKGGSPSPSVKPGQPGAGQGKGNFVICEICDGYIKDLEQLRNHMQWIHKVKIHPKMIYNRPPLNCQKCQFRFFTDQGLERHLLGSHGLVTASMQDAANKGQDSGRCPVCGKVYQWKLLNHVAKDHNKTLKPAHLSYKCTVCTATFGQYKLFENHVYTAHSGVAKKADKAKQQQAAAKQSSVLKPGAQVGGLTPTSKKDEKEVPAVNEVIDLDDEEEIDDVEKDDKNAEVIDLGTPKKADNAEDKSAKRVLEDAQESEKKKAKTSGEVDTAAE